jgi:broad specificity phosphatase PhoE
VKSRRTIAPRMAQDVVAGGRDPVASAPMAVHLVRHAHAGSRSDWNGDDRHRPLSDRGADQAEWLRARLGDADVGRVVSSPFLRCVQTVEPLARAVEVEVEPDDALAEGADPQTALELLLSLEADNGVACSHGDLIPVLLRALVAAGMEVDGALLDKKGSLWVIELDDGRPIRGRYVPPGT